MIGSRPLTDEEIVLITRELKTNRDKCLFILGLKTGFRISELLSIKVKDVIQYGKITDSVTVNRSNMKGKHSSRTVKLHPDAKIALETMGTLTMGQNEELFPFGRRQAQRIIREAVEKAQVVGKVTTHSMRKSFAQRVYHKLDRDLIKTQKAMGHKSLSSTAHYLSFEQKEIDDAVLTI